MDVKKEIVKENQRVTVSMSMLKDAMIRLLGKKPIQQISVSELCREAGVNRSTFYRLYSIPIEVMEDIIQEHITRIHSMISFSEDARMENTKMIYKYLFDHRDVFIPILHNYDYRIIVMLEKKFYNVFRKNTDSLSQRKNVSLSALF